MTSECSHGQLGLTAAAISDQTDLLRADRHAIDVNQDYAGFSGSLFASSSELTTISPCTGGPPGGDPNATSCVFPVTQSWYKPLSGRDAHHSVMAVLLVNNGHEPRDLSFTFAEVPGLLERAGSTHCLFDVWAGVMLDGARFGGFEAKAVAPHDSVFLKIGDHPLRC